MSFFFNSRKSINAKLVKAAGKGDVAQVKKLAEAGADINQPGADGPLFAAAYMGDSDAHHQVIEYLLAHGAEVDIRNTVNCTPLMGAANQGNSGAVRTLLAAGADPTLTGRDKTAFQWALTSGNEETMYLLQPRPERRPDNADEVTVLHTVGNRTIEEVFNFASKERITFVRAGIDGPVEAVTRQNFKEIGDRAALHAAFERYVAKGGKADESDIFPEVLVKIRPPAKGNGPMIGNGNV